MKEILSSYAVYLIEFLIAYLYYSHMFNKKKSNNKLLSIGLILYLIAGTFYILFDNTIVNLLSFILINLLFSRYAYSIKFTNALFHSIILSAVVTISEFSSMYLLSTINKSDFTIYKTNYTIYVLDVIFSKTVYLLICIMIIYFMHGEENRSSKFSFSLMIYPSCVMGIIILFRDLYYNNLGIKYNTEISIISFILLLSVILNFIIYESSNKREKELLELQNEFQKKEINETYLGILEHQNKELQILAHDIKNHLTMIEILSNDEKVEKYVSTIYHDIIKYSIVGNTNNKILDLILGKYQTLCDMNKIDFQISIKTANLDYVDDSDLSTLLNNLLDNALEAAKQSKRKFIILTIKRVNEIDMLNIINSCDVKPKSNNSNLLTTKKDKNIHGFGTKSIKKITAKYGGEFEWKFDSIDNTFHSTIIFANR